MRVVTDIKIFYTLSLPKNLPDDLGAARPVIVQRPSDHLWFHAIKELSRASCDNQNLPCLEPNTLDLASLNFIAPAIIQFGGSGITLRCNPLGHL